MKTKSNVTSWMGSWNGKKTLGKNQRDLNEVRTVVNPNPCIIQGSTVYIFNTIAIKNIIRGTSLVVQWLGLCASTVGGTGSMCFHCGGHGFHPWSGK